MRIHLSPIAFVRNSRKIPVDDHWNTVSSEIVLAHDVPTDAFLNLGGFSHLDVIFFFDKVQDEDVVYSGPPRGNPAYPLTGIFGRRKKDRPNKPGLCTVELVGVSGRTLTVRRLDAIDGSPVLDIKPVFKKFLPAGEVRQPAWVSDLMKAYW